MEYVLSLIWIYMEMVFFIVLSKAFLQEIKSNKQIIIACLPVGLAVFLIVNLFEDRLLEQLLTCTCYIGLSISMFKGSWLWHLLISIMCFIFAGILDTAVLYGMSALLGISFSEFVWRQLSYTVTVTVGKLLTILFAWLIYQFRKRERTQKVHPRWLLLTLTFPVVSLVMLFVVFDSYQNSNDLSIGAFLFSVGLAVANVAILYLVQRMETQTKKEHEIILLNQQMEIQTDSIVALEKSYRAQRQATHDFRHHIQTLEELVSENRIETAHKYLAQLQETQSARILCVNSRHPIVDAVVNQKYQIARERNIDVQIQVNDLSHITIETSAIVVLLSNLFDNAIEACERCDHDRSIQCSIIANDSLFVSIRNSSNPVTIIGDTIETSKEPKEEHGYGLMNIRRVLDQLEAEYAFNYEDGYFQFVAEIPN